MTSNVLELRPKTPWARTVGLPQVLAAWESDARFWRNVTLDGELPPSTPSEQELPAALPSAVRGALAQRGISHLYSHQSRALGLALSGSDFVIATPTASGKSLCYNLPVLSALSSDPSARALYLFPTKALSRDQEEGLRSLMRDAGVERGVVTYDGDTPADARRAAREQAAVLVTNPDMLHSGILPHHALWARCFANLRYVVIDELHIYRGVFGSHLANVVRRLQRIARFHGSNPTFIFASATIGNPREHAQAMLGRDVELIAESGASTGARRVMVYNPPVVNAELGIRQSYVKAAVKVASDLVLGSVPTIVFGQSRNNVEVMLKYLRDRLETQGFDTDAVQGYRGGYLPQTRRRIESGLRDGSVRCVVATSALELGIDIGSLDAVVCAGFPGSIAGMWQRFGRAGRRGEQSLAVLVTSSAPLDQYLARAREALLGAPIEHARIDPDNVDILMQHLKCAAFELPFASGEAFGNVPASVTDEALQFLADHQVVHAVPGQDGAKVYHWMEDAYPANHISLRSMGWDNFVIIDADSDTTLAEMDWRSAHTMLHEQAIYQHEAAQYQVERLDYENHKAFVRKVAPDYYTDAMTHTRIAVIDSDAQESLKQGAWALDAGLGDVSVVEKVVGFKKIKFHTHENVGYGEVNLPAMQMHTTAFWLTFPEALVLAQEMPRPVVIDSLRGLGKALHTVAAVGLMIDPRDLGRTLGDTGEVDGPPQKVGPARFNPTLFLYDGTPGGVGLAARLYENRAALLAKAMQLIRRCECHDGCPACVGPIITLPDTDTTISPKRIALRMLASLEADKSSPSGRES